MGTIESCVFLFSLGATNTDFVTRPSAPSKQFRRTYSHVSMQLLISHLMVLQKKTTEEVQDRAKENKYLPSSLPDGSPDLPLSSFSFSDNISEILACNLLLERVLDGRCSKMEEF